MKDNTNNNPFLLCIFFMSITVYVSGFANLVDKEVFFLNFIIMFVVGKMGIGYLDIVALRLVILMLVFFGVILYPIAM